MDEDILEKIFKRAGIPKELSQEYAKQFSRNSITVDKLLDDSDILRSDVGKGIAVGDKIKMKQMLETGRDWIDLFKRIGMVGTVCTEYAITFLVQGMTRDMLRDVTDEDLKELEVNALGDRKKILKAAKLYLLQIPCSGEIKRDDVMRIISEYACMWKSNDIDRQLLQEAASLVIKQPISNGVLEVEGESMHLFFGVGSKESYYKVYLENGVPTSVCFKNGNDKVTRQRATGDMVITETIDSDRSSRGERVLMGAIGGGTAGALAGAALGFIVAGPVGAVVLGADWAYSGSLVGAGAGVLCDSVMGPTTTRKYTRAVEYK